MTKVKEQSSEERREQFSQVAWSLKFSTEQELEKIFEQLPKVEKEKGREALEGLVESLVYSNNPQVMAFVAKSPYFNVTKHAYKGLEESKYIEVEKALAGNPGIGFYYEKMRQLALHESEEVVGILAANVAISEDGVTRNSLMNSFYPSVQKVLMHNPVFKEYLMTEKQSAAETFVLNLE